MLECTIGIHCKGQLVLYRSCTDASNRWFLGCTRRGLRCRACVTEALQMGSPRRALPVLIGRASADSLLAIHSFDTARQALPPTRLDGPCWQARLGVTAQISCLDRTRRSDRSDRLGRVPPGAHPLTGTATGTP